MILRRFISHVKAENWFAVGIDFFVVVIGIFVGLQATEWNEDRKENALRGEYLQKLHQDLKSDIGRMEFVANVGKTRLEYTQFLEEVSKNTQLAYDNPEKFFQAINQATSNFGFDTQNITFEELKASGRLSILNNPELEKKLSNHYIRVHTRIGFNRRGEQKIDNFLLFTSGLLNVEKTLQLFRFSREDLNLPDLVATPDEALQVANDFASRKDAVNYLGAIANLHLSKMRLPHEEGARANELVDELEVEMQKIGIAPLENIS